VEDVSSFSSRSLYTQPTNVPLISFNTVGNVFIDAYVFWSPSKFVEFKQRGVASRVLESGCSCRHFCVKKRALMRCLEPNLHRHVRTCCQSLNHFHHRCSNHHLCNGRKIEKKKKNGFFHSGIVRFSGVLSFGSKCRVFPVRNSPVFGRVHFRLKMSGISIQEFCGFILNVTYFSCIFMSNMSPIALFPAMDFASMPLVSFGFLFLVVIEIGSLARFTCFSNVDLSCIFWSISNPFFQNTVLLCFLSSLWNSLQ